MALTICNSISLHCFRLMRDWKLESFANGKEISAVPFRTEKDEYLWRYSTISEWNFRNIILYYHLTSNRNFRIFWPNGKHPRWSLTIFRVSFNTAVLKSKASKSSYTRCQSTSFGMGQKDGHFLSRLIWSWLMDMFERLIGSNWCGTLEVVVLSSLRLRRKSLRFLTSLCRPQ